MNNTTCEHEGCQLVPYFSYKDEHHYRFCSKHKLPGMKRKNKRVPVCEHNGCTKMGYFNEPGEKIGRFCNSHKGPEMKNVIYKRNCGHEGCSKTAGFWDPSDKNRVLFCGTHKLDGMVSRNVTPLHPSGQNTQNRSIMLTRVREKIRNLTDMLETHKRHKVEIDIEIAMLSRQVDMMSDII